MAVTPYIVSGTISDKDSIARGSGITVTVTDTTLGESTTATTNSSGNYVADLANLTSDYSVGDAISVIVSTTGITGYVPNATTETSTGTVGSGAGSTINVSISILDVDYTTLRTDCWDLMKKLLDDSYYAITTNNIHAAMNDALISSEGYPQVTIYIPTIESTSKDFKRELVGKSVNFMIEIYHKSSEALKEVTDEVESKIESAEVDGVFASSFLHNLDMPDNDYDWWTDSKKKIHRATLNCNFDYVGRR